MGGVKQLAAVQIGHGAGHPQNAVVGAGAVAQALERAAQDLFGGGSHAAVPPQRGRGQLRIAPHAGQGLVALPLQGAGSNDPGAHIGAGLAALLGREIVIFDRKCLHMQVDAVQQRP